MSREQFSLQVKMIDITPLQPWSFPQFYLLIVLVFFSPLSIFWLLAMTKKFLFWLWLWQLKDYHLWRFADHFRTYKGKRLIFNYFNSAKLLCFLSLVLNYPRADFSKLSKGLLFFSCFSLLLLFIFLTETMLGFYRLSKRKLKRPVKTKKTLAILTSGLLAIEFLLFFFRNKFGFDKRFVIALSAIDLLSPLIFSLFILSFQPLTVFLRNRVLKKAIEKRKQFKDLMVIGITGSYGKSSTKEFLATILSEKFNGSTSSPQRVLKTEKNINSEIGIARTILDKLRPEHEIFICEMGAYRPGGIKLLCDIAKPKIGILTGVNEQHMATFGSQEKTINTKFELIKALPENGTAIVNYDDKFIAQNLKSKVIKCSAQQIENLSIEKHSIFFEIEDAEFRINLAGKQNMINLLMAIACAQELDMSLQEISDACKKIKSFRKTMELKQGRGGVQIIDDTYSANPKGVMAALEHLKLWSGKKMIVMPCLIELGKASKRIHQEIGERMGQACDLAVITTRDRFEEIKKGATSAGMGENQILFLENPDQIFEKLEPYLNSENVILLESRVPERLIIKLS